MFGKVSTSLFMVLSEKCHFYDQNNAQKCINCLSYFTLFFPFVSKGVEIHFVEPVNFGLFCVVVSLCVSTALKKKKKKSCGISNLIVKNVFTPLSLGQKTSSWKTGIYGGFLIISKYKTELRFQSTFPVVPHFPVLVCSITTIPLSHPLLPSVAFLSALPRREFELSSLPQQTLFTR